MSFYDINILEMAGNVNRFLDDRKVQISGRIVPCLSDYMGKVFVT